MSAWAAEYGADPSQAQMSRLSLGDKGHAPSAWVSEYLGSAGPAASPSGLGSQWAEQYTIGRPQSEQWAEEYASSTGQVICESHHSHVWLFYLPLKRSRLSMSKLVIACLCGIAGATGVFDS